jgi:hypothetical protein
VMAEMDTIRKTLYAGKYWQDGETMSQVIVKLALLNSFLGEQISDYELDANTFESQYKSTREQRKLELIKQEQQSATQAESQAYVDTSELRDTWNQSVHSFKQLQVKRNDTSNLIDALRSRLSFMKAERMEVKS